MTYGRSLKRIRAREWPAIRAEWHHIANDYEEIGEPPPLGVLDILEQNGSILPTTGTEKEGKFDIVGVRETVLREGIFLLHKAAALLRSASRDIDARQYTHAEVTAYTASVFAAKAVCTLLGVWFSPKKVANENWFIDCFSREKRRQFYVNAIRAQSQRIGHREVWSLLQRLITVTSDLPLDAPMLELIQKSEVDRFAKHRNRIQYFNLAWAFDDLHGDQSTAPDWITPFRNDLYADIDPDGEDSHFTMFFLLMMLRSGFLLFSDVSTATPGFRHELDLLRRNTAACESSIYVQIWLDTEAA